MFDRTARRKHDLDIDDDEDEAKIAAKLEARIMRKIRRTTGIGIRDTGELPGAGPNVA